ncbi:hypothetical protein F4810DRAFT_685151 [Camillea tinctor]|nr:hypothetical protein F4810DRAFT_685151 [Camillea tinctor]
MYLHYLYTCMYLPAAVVAYVPRFIIRPATKFQRLQCCQPIRLNRARRSIFDTSCLYYITCILLRVAVAIVLILEKQLNKTQ